MPSHPRSSEQSRSTMEPRTLTQRDAVLTEILTDRIVRLPSYRVTRMTGALSLRGGRAGAAGGFLVTSDTSLRRERLQNILAAVIDIVDNDLSDDDDELTW